MKFAFVFFVFSISLAAFAQNPARFRNCTVDKTNNFKQVCVNSATNANIAIRLQEHSGKYRYICGTATKVVRDEYLMYGLNNGYEYRDLFVNYVFESCTEEGRSIDNRVLGTGSYRYNFGMGQEPTEIAWGYTPDRISFDASF
jgi:hypothetical protein